MLKRHTCYKKLGFNIVSLVYAVTCSQFHFSLKQQPVDTRAAQEYVHLLQGT